MVGLLFLALSLFASEDPADDAYFEEPPFLFVSLGSHCEVASVLKENHLREVAFPFDSLVTIDSEGMIAALNEDFGNFLNKEGFFPYSLHPDITENSFYKMEFRHEGPILENADGWQRTKEKYERRIGRFRQIRDFKGRTFFIRIAYDLPHGGATYWLQEGQTTISSAQAHALKEALDRYFPFLNFTLIILNYVEDLPEPIQEINGVIEFKIRKSHRHTDHAAILNLLSHS